MSTEGFAASVLRWFGENGRRDLPWQQDPTPYRVWVSEIMLQQTQVATVIPYYRRFIESFPTVKALADAGIDDVLHHWSGLGYYARARNLHRAAGMIRDEHAGEFPRGVDRVMALPGIGRSTAAAILALSRGERHAILDGNVKRVLARCHAVEGWPGTAPVASALWQIAERHTPEADVAAYTQAMMDLGATVCTRTKPLCDRCPLADRCEAHASGTATLYPGRRARTSKPRRKTHMVLVQCKDAIYLERRPAAGVWGGLWSFPEIESEDDLPGWCEAALQVAPAGIERWDTVHHSFTHFDLEIQPIAVRVDERSRKVADTGDRVWYAFDSAQRLGFAAPVSGLIRKLKELNANVTNS